MIPGAAESMAWLERHAIPYVFVTNTTSCARGDLVAKLLKLGIAARASQIHTPAVAANRWLADNATGPAALFVPPPVRDEFRSIPHLDDHAESGAASVVIGDLGDAWDFPTLNRAFRLLMGSPQAQLVALGMTRYWLAEDGLRLDVAAFVKALEHAADRRAVVLGKPAAEFFETALGALACPAGEAVMVGDDIRGDVHAAQQLGITGVLVRTGKFRDADLGIGISPEAVLDSIADLPGWWQAQTT